MKLVDVVFLEGTTENKLGVSMLFLAEPTPQLE